MSAPSSAMSPGLVVLVLTLLLGIQPVTTDLYLPALPTLTQGFGASVAQAQFTLTALLLAFGVSQLVWGPLSDRFGRRPILIGGMLLYMAATTGGAFSQSMDQLIAWRTLQGVAMGSAVMCARAIVRDLYAPSEGARVMSKGLTGLGVIACCSAPLGGLLSDHYGWRVALLALSVFGAGTLALLVWRFQETVPRRNPDALRPGPLLRNWSHIARNPTFWAWTLLATASYAGLFSYLASSSFVLIGVLGLSKTQYGIVMFTMSLVYIVGTFICRRLLVRLGVRRTVGLAAIVTLTGGTLIGVLPLLGVQGLWSVLLPFYLFMLGHGVHQPCGQSGAVAPFPQAAGAASALAGFLMMVVAFGIGGWLSLALSDPALGAGTVRPLTDSVWFWCVVIATTAWTLVQRHGEPHTPPTRVATT
ncbi:multidrug effflux MFS transporter [Hydrogenophaga sp. SNF1]|uniref:multidrug effflux MFS transporter n=1 Tax=Hydrogenophaga sp. SNF1 TaxID=3098762 RepID=UPI002ACC19D4|nr:multidrug effflux MFS transporter [Hydrogenophaga sp. SNF1]WQB85121.1 multidrug effflux MFS transporter [Hydrogenophaga sp. SNF1]